METNESLDFGLLKTFVENNPRKNVGNIINGYFEGIFKYLKVNFEFIENAKSELGRIE